MSKDILLNDSGDLMVRNGDFVIGESDGQHIQHIFEAEPGDFKQSPLVGLGIRKKINGIFNGIFRREAMIQLLADGFTVNKLVIEKENIEIDAYR